MNKNSPNIGEKTRKVFNDLFTGIDGETIDISRVLWILGIVVFLALSGWQVYKTGNFDMVNYGLAYSGLLAAGAAGVRIKQTQEPPNKTTITDGDK